MDALSDVLSLVKPRSYVAGGLTAGGRWAVQFPPHQGIKCYVVARGACWFVIDGVRAPIRLAKDQCLMLPQGAAFKICSALDARPFDARILVTGKAHNGVRAIAPGDDVYLLGGNFALDGNAELLRGVLPSYVHLHTRSDRRALRDCVVRMGDELRDARPGSTLIAQHCAYTMLVLALRRCLTSDGVGWLSALADPRLARALTAMHDRPATGWTVESLAAVAGMSRTAFAARFRRVVGATPLDYLTRWRMRLAGDRLRHTDDAIGAVARLVGYDSESAFGAAFKRTMGASPRAFRRSGAPAGSTRVARPA